MSGKCFGGGPANAAGVYSCDQNDLVGNLGGESLCNCACLGFSTELFVACHIGEDSSGNFGRRAGGGSAGSRGYLGRNLKLCSVRVDGNHFIFMEKDTCTLFNREIIITTEEQRIYRRLEEVPNDVHTRNF